MPITTDLDKLRELILDNDIDKVYDDDQLTWYLEVNGNDIYKAAAFTLRQKAMRITDSDPERSSFYRSQANWIETNYATPAPGNPRMRVRGVGESSPQTSTPSQAVQGITTIETNDGIINRVDGQQLTLGLADDGIQEDKLSSGIRTKLNQEHPDTDTGITSVVANNGLTQSITGRQLTLGLVIPNASITGPKIVSNAITSAKINDGAVSEQKLSSGVRTKLNASGGEENVQSNWNETDATDDSYILNKPTIPAAQVNANWTETNSSSKAFILNKPTIPAAQVNANWTETNSSSKAFIANKPDLSTYVEKSELETETNVRFASYNNGALSSNYWDGTWCLYNQASGPPVEANAIGQPDIGDDDTVVVAFGSELRTDSDPSHYVAGTRNTADDYPNGSVIHVNIWNRPGARMVITLTSGGTLVGTGSAQYIWATATLDEINDVSDVVDYGDYFRIAATQATKLQIEIPYTDVLGLDGQYARLDGTNVSDDLIDAIQGDNESSTLRNLFRVNATNVDYYVSLNENNTPYTASIRLPSSQANTQDDLDLIRLLKDRAWLTIGDDEYTIDITSNATRSIIGTSLTFAFNYVVVNGTKPTGSSTRKLTVDGEDVHRGELARAAFRNENPSIDGTGGTDGQYWGKDANGAGWRDVSGGSTYSETQLYSGILSIAGSNSNTTQYWRESAGTIDFSSYDAIRFIMSRGGHGTQSSASNDTLRYEMVYSKTLLDLLTARTDGYSWTNNSTDILVETNNSLQFLRTSGSSLLFKSNSTTRYIRLIIHGINY